MAKKSGDPLFLVRLHKGLADRKRLPLAHVISVLDELRQLITEIGRDIQRRRGVAHATGDFGLELVAGERGIAFLPGSVQASIAVTERSATGAKAIQSIIETVGLLDSDEFADESVDRQIDRRIILRLSRIAKIQKQDHTEMSLGILNPGQTRPLTATFGSNGIATVRSLQTPTFRVENSVLFGKLIQLLDRTTTEDEEEKGFWGELRTDNGEVWRVQFKPSDVARATSLFRERVKVTGLAIHYRFAHPKLICADIEADRERDFDAAFDQLFGCNKNAYKADLQTILKGIRGEE